MMGICVSKECCYKRNKEVNMKHTVKMVGIFGMTALLAIPGFAQVGSRMQGRNMRAPRMQNGMMVMLKARQSELKLTDKQLASIQGLVDAHRKAEVDMQREAALQRLEIQKLSRDRVDMDLDLYRKSLEKASALRISGQLARLRLHQDINKVLTVEQRDVLKRILSKTGTFRGRDGRFTRGRTFREFGRRTALNQSRARNSSLRKRIIR